MKTAKFLHVLGITIIILGIFDFLWSLVRMHPVSLHVLVYGFDTYVMALFQRIFEGAVLIGIARLLKNQNWN